jgi:hypothetical protein
MENQFNSSSIPVMRSPADLMNNGPNSDNLAAGAMHAHPIDRMQRGEYRHNINNNTDSSDNDNKEIAL